MDTNLKKTLIETLNLYKKIEFEVHAETKGALINIVIGKMRNEDCGTIYDDLSYWLGYWKKRRN